MWRVVGHFLAARNRGGFSAMNWDHLSKTLLGWSGGQAQDHSGGFKRALRFKTPYFHPHTLRCFHISPTVLPLQQK